MTSPSKCIVESTAAKTIGIMWELYHRGRRVAPMSDAKRKIEVYRALHETGCFVLPNPWDVGSAHLPAAARLSRAGDDVGRLRVRARAARRGRGGAARRRCWRTLATWPAATSLPVNADFQSGYAARSRRRGRQRRAVRRRPAWPGCRSRTPPATSDAPLYERDAAVARVARGARSHRRQRHAAWC